MPLVIKQESTSYDVAASELLNLLCSIINAVCIQSRKKGMQLTIFYWLLTIFSVFICVNLRFIRMLIQSTQYAARSTQSLGLLTENAARIINAVSRRFFENMPDVS
jgi:hypothetical protein